jgi:monoterpene epsilon-lactone hydrolase
MASKEFEAFYQEILAHRVVGPDEAIANIRESFETFLSEFPPADDITFEKVAIHSLQAERCYAAGSDMSRILLFFHSGAYNAGSTHSHRDLMGRLAKSSRIPVLGINYRLAPEHPYPAALEDAIAVYGYLLEENYKPSDIILIGSSAGGGLALSLLLFLKKNMILMPAGAIGICPWVDLAMQANSIHSNTGKDVITPERLKVSVDLYCNGHDAKDPFISPLYGDLAALPPLMLQCGARELLLDEIKLFAERAKADGTEVTLEIWPEMFHTWQLFASKIPEGQKAIEHMATWIQGCFSKQTSAISS